MYSNYHYLFQIQFDQSYTLRYIRMMQRTYEYEQFKDFALTFEDGSTQNVSKTYDAVNNAHKTFFDISSWLTWAKISQTLKQGAASF